MKILKIIYYIIFICIGAVAVLLLVSILPISGNIKFMIVQSGSMEPAIKMGSIIMVRPIDDYNIGNIITFGPYNTKNPPITHRILEIKNIDGQISYVTKGDANAGADREGVTKKEVIGKVLVSVPYVGFVVNALRKPIVFALIIIVPAILIIFQKLIKIKNEIVKIKKEKGV